MAPRNDLIHDISLAILAASDVPSAFKAFHKIAFSRSIWVALLLDMDSRIKFELPPGQSIDELPTRTLIDLAKRAILGPISWSPHSPFHSKPVVSHEIALPFGTVLDAGVQFGAYLVPGGNYVLVGSSRLQCWDLSTKRCLWTHESLGNPSDWSMVQNFAFEMVDDDKAMILLIWMRNSYPGSWDRRNAVEIVHLDLSTRKSRLLLSLNAQDTGLF
ncbi:hypothetical protein BDZ94DRAFT_1311342 [Collybia nuda]|uniref:Uncharacterized protein n=1 Tax=Collybia nuda TaxID=64659 RepID=A0A9P5Y354_9AGAR|nr:hypothetical protein BDZ94DRAFT_1311342 [Collybia nuda]